MCEKHKAKKYKEPPIGATPAFIVIPQRIGDLAEHIKLYAEEGNIANNGGSTVAVREWANEIICHCDTLDKLQDISKE